MRHILLLITVFVCCLFSSCMTYYLSPESFRAQLAGRDSSGFKKVTIIEPTLGMTREYLKNPVDTIVCTNKKGEKGRILNSASIEVIFTYGASHKKQLFYFDRLYVTDSLVYGSDSRVVPAISSIPTKEITRIQLRDNGKNTVYRNKGR